MLLHGVVYSYPAAGLDSPPCLSELMDFALVYLVCVVIMVSTLLCDIIVHIQLVLISPFPDWFFLVKRCLELVILL